MKNGFKMQKFEIAHWKLLYFKFWNCRNLQ